MFISVIGKVPMSVRNDGYLRANEAVEISVPQLFSRLSICQALVLLAVKDVGYSHGIDEPHIVTKDVPSSVRCFS